MKLHHLLTMSALGLLTGAVIAANTSGGVALPNCDTRDATCREWREAVQMLNDAGGASLGGAGGERPDKPTRPGPAYLKSLNACIKHQVSTHKLTQAAARARCETLMSKPGQL